MTGPLRNPKHEAFVQFLLQGESYVDAHEHAGFRRDDGNACRLAKNPKVQARLAELQNEIAGENKVTVASLLNELEAARDKASSLDQLSAAVRAIEAKAKISGLLINRTEVGGVGEFSGETPHELASELAASYLSTVGNTAFKSITEIDRDTLANLIVEACEKIDAFCQTIAARPINKDIQTQTIALLANGKATAQ